jgi:hypothetical protein
MARIHRRDLDDGQTPVGAASPAAKGGRNPYRADAETPQQKCQ